MDHTGIDVHKRESKIYILSDGGERSSSSASVPSPSASIRIGHEAGSRAWGELHLYHAASDMTLSAAEVERQAIDVVREVKRSLRIPVAVKDTRRAVLVEPDRTTPDSRYQRVPTRVTQAEQE